jgi:hypothetical protein
VYKREKNTANTNKPTNPKKNKKERFFREIVSMVDARLKVAMNRLYFLLS